VRRYNPEEVEGRWQQIWARESAFEVPNPDAAGVADDPPRTYVLEMLPYPSGELHMGHVKNYTLGDVLTHFRRRNGESVLRPMGYDAFGLPAENAAIREGGHPKTITERNIAAIREQMGRMGWAIDWSREISSHTPEYYRWTQWLFLKFHEQGLAYRQEAPVNWCPVDQTVLANEQVVEGCCERCGAEVEQKDLEQWFFKITDYADRLLDEMELLESWPERVLTMQRNWIGRSHGAEVRFRIDDLRADVPVFTTRPDTLFGATFFVLAPEHPLVEELVRGMSNEEAVLAYVEDARTRTTLERASAEREKSGIDTGRTITNPVNGEQLPIWVADYVLMEYGTGAIMAVPGHDERDFEFAGAFGLEIRQVVEPSDGSAVELPYIDKSTDARSLNSEQFSGLLTPEAIAGIIAWLEERELGEGAVHYRLRDWLLSRQRYWGCPIPIVFCDSCGTVPVPLDDLPVLLPEVDDYVPRGRSPLAAAEDWVAAACPSCGGPGRRETDTMDTFVDSSWYFLRYTDAQCDTLPVRREIVDYWAPINQYIGGIEHAILHLMYARFFTKVMNDLGLVGFREPFLRLFTQGMIYNEGTKMSKSKGNVVPPDALIERFGADALRLYIMFIGPAEDDVEWQDTGIEGTSRFLGRLWRVVQEAAESSASGGGAQADGAASPLTRKAHETIAKVSDDIDRRFQFNTPVAAVMELVNDISRTPEDPGARLACETAVSLIQPYAPHVAEELWEQLGHERLWEKPWPVADDSLLARETFELVVQVNGKVRDRAHVATGLGNDELVAAAMALPKVQAQLEGRDVRKTIVVPDKLVNLVIG
jgi:leucyl-tRNA synthetase